MWGWHVPTKTGDLRPFLLGRSVFQLSSNTWMNWIRMGWRIFIPNTSLFVKVLQKPMGCNRQKPCNHAMCPYSRRWSFKCNPWAFNKKNIFNQFTFDGVEIYKFKIQEKWTKEKEEEEVHLFATTPWLQLNVILEPSLKNKISNQFTFDGVQIYKVKIQEKWIKEKKKKKFNFSQPLYGFSFLRHLGVLQKVYGF